MGFCVSLRRFSDAPVIQTIPRLPYGVACASAAQQRGRFDLAQLIHLDEVVDDLDVA